MDRERKSRLDQLNRRVAELQQARKWISLKRLRHKRRHVAEYFDRVDAIRIAKMAKEEGSMDTRRISQSAFWCLNCGLQYNADWNAAINLGSVFLPEALSRGATEGLAYAGDELVYKPASPETENNVDIMVSTR